MLSSSLVGSGSVLVLFELDRDVFGDPDAVAQAQGPAVDEGGLDAFQAGCFTGVDGGREVVLGQVGEGVLEAGRQEAVLGAGDVEADGAVVAVADGQFGDLLAAVGVAHGGDQLADLDLAAGLGHGVHAGFEAGLHGLDNFVQAQALLQVLFGCPAHFAVDHAVVGEVLDEFLGDAEQAFLGLHHGDGVVEGFEVADQRAGVGGFAEPLPQRDRIGRGQRVADGLGQLDDGGRAEPAIQVVVKGNLGQALQVEVEVRGSVRNSLSHVPTLGSEAAYASRYLRAPDAILFCRRGGDGAGKLRSSARKGGAGRGWPAVEPFIPQFRRRLRPPDACVRQRSAGGDRSGYPARWRKPRRCRRSAAGCVEPREGAGQQADADGIDHPGGQAKASSKKNRRCGKTCVRPHSLPPPAPTGCSGR